jgi:hypothetical protein
MKKKFQNQKNILKNLNLKLKPGWRVLKIYEDIHIIPNFFKIKKKIKKNYFPSANRILFRF